MGINRLTGTPWHITYMNKGRNPCHPHRHKAHCIYYEGCHTEYCKKIDAKCFGSMNCEWYTIDSKKKSKHKTHSNVLSDIFSPEANSPKRVKWNCHWFKKKKQLCTKHNRYYQLECDKCEYWKLGNYKEPNQQKTTKNKKGPKKMSSRRLIQRPSSGYYKYRF